jgi:hypothetical protein
MLEQSPDEFCLKPLPRSLFDYLPRDVLILFGRMREHIERRQTFDPCPMCAARNAFGRGGSCVHSCAEIAK